MLVIRQFICTFVLQALARRDLPRKTNVAWAGGKDSRSAIGTLIASDRQNTRRLCSNPLRRIYNGRDPGSGVAVTPEKANQTLKILIM